MIDYEDSCYGCDYHEEDGGCTCQGDCNGGSGRIIGRIPGTLPESNTVGDVAKSILEDLPSTMIEPLTDNEQRIFLSAMEREMKICKEVDKQYIREAYEDSLVYICNEINRKVKGILWRN